MFSKAGSRHSKSKLIFLTSEEKAAVKPQKSGASIYADKKETIRDEGTEGSGNEENSIYWTHHQVPLHYQCFWRWRVKQGRTKLTKKKFWNIPKAVWNAEVKSKWSKWQKKEETVVSTRHSSLRRKRMNPMGQNAVQGAARPSIDCL